MVNQLVGSHGASDFNLVVFASQTDYDLAADLAANYPEWDGRKKDFYVIVGALAELTPTTISNYAFDSGSLPAGSTLHLTVKGDLMGYGGAKGVANGGAGSNGGPCIRVDTVPITLVVDGAGIIRGGGGGGGAGNAGGGLDSTSGDSETPPGTTPCAANGGDGGDGAGAQNSGLPQPGGSRACCGNVTYGCGVDGGAGGILGVDGEASSGAAGLAGVTLTLVNGATLLNVPTGDILPVIP